MFTKKTFTLTNDEYNAIEKWAKSHECSARCADRASQSSVGGEISIIFTPTTVGTFVAAQCICGKKIDVDSLLG